MSVTRRKVLGGIAAGALTPLASSKVFAAREPSRSVSAANHEYVRRPIANPQMPLELESPLRQQRVKLDLSNGQLRYSLSFQDKEVIGPSILGLKMDGSARLDSSFALLRAWTGEHHGSWAPVCGERAVCPDNYRALVVEVQETIPPHRKISVEFRTYDEGLAFRYVIDEQAALANFVIADESTEFRLADGAYGWSTVTAQGVYKKIPIRELPPASERPFLIHLPNGLWAAIAEAAVENYPSMFLTTLRAEKHYLAAKLMGPAECKAPFASPWRVILAGVRAGDLVEHNYLLSNLCPPSRAESTSWIKAGKVMREMTLSTRGGHELVDFAAAQNIQFIEYDAGWYGDQDDESSDATKVNVQASSTHGELEYQGLDLREVISYARSKNIGVILYINRRVMERQLASVLRTYNAWGVAGVKYGFVNVHTQPWTKLLYDAIRMAGEHRLLLDIHDEFRPTGMSRTYPHLLTQEGVRGNEEFPSATLNTVVPFTRSLAGAADATCCWLDPRLKNTWGHQMALPVVIFSPWQFIYWYDRPTAFTGPSIGMEWFRELPTTWDDTRVLSGEPENHVVIARRQGHSWFIGAIANDDFKTLSVPLNMLDAGKVYTAWIYSDGEGPKDVRKTIRTFRRDDVLELSLQSRGGTAIRLFLK